MEPLIQELDGYTVFYTAQADKKLEEAIHQKIKDFNRANSEHHRRIMETGVKALDLCLCDHNGETIGALVSSTYWGWLYIDYLWVADALRGKHYGSRLLALAEAEAVRRGCTRATLTTFSFQARRFYEKYGYRVVGELEDYPPGQAFYWMKKELPTEVEGGRS